MATASASRVIAASLENLWDLIGDPHHLPRWWPRVERIEDVHDGAFTEVMKTKKGKVVRADFQLLDADEATRTLRWEQRVQGTPFEQVLQSSLTEVRLQDIEGESTTRVIIELSQQLRRRQSNALITGLAPRLGSYMVRRAARSTIEQALDGLAQISG
ncbi:MAG TPA: SRPBCC family protein [Solirubrobacteraceae bacterium]|nr:SRPBCC family protein [Solirubrobacteraceae bacterium]